MYVSEQLEDYNTVFQWVRKNPQFDRDKIVLWGFSFSGMEVLRDLCCYRSADLQLTGGHVLTLSAEVSMRMDSRTSLRNLILSLNL